jgi:multidrug resistance efflux pump
MKRQFLYIILSFAAIGCKEKQQTVQVQTKMLTSAVYASGSLMPEEEYKVISSVDGYLVRASVKEGDNVKKGDLLFTVSSMVRNAQEQGARALVNRTLPTAIDNAPLLRELQARIEVARIKMQQDSLQYARYKTLYEQNAISQSNYEKYYLQYQSSLKDYQSLRQQYKQQELAGDIQLQQARNQLTVAAAQSDVGNLRSFANGIVYDVYKKEGDLITPNQPIALIGAGKMIARLLVDEDDLDKVSTGQKVVITMDAFPDKVFKAHVEKIYPLLNKVEQSFRVDAVLDEPVPVEMYGLNLEANIVIAENKQVNVIPRSVLLKGDSVLIKEGDKTKKIKIEKGIEDEQWVEVRSGINKNTIIIKES